MEYFSLSDIKKKNLTDVFHYIYNNPATSKQAIANALSMSLPTVTQHLATLLDNGFIEKCGQLRSTVGRKATAYSAVATARIAVGVEILSDNIYVVALNLYGKKEVKEKTGLHFHPDDSYFVELKDIVKDFLVRNHFSEAQLLGIGLAIQGLASSDGRTITYGRILKSEGLSIDTFAGYFSAPCCFIHDAECAANSELWENPDVTDAIYLSLGYHLGGAIILDGHLQRGLTGKSGTFEHITLVRDGLPCYCGRKGCAECYCSANALLSDEASLDSFFDKKNAGDTACIARWKDYLHSLAILIKDMHLVIESTVILGGLVTPYFTEEDIQTLREDVLNLSTFREPTDYIITGRCRSDAVSIGAALPFIHELLSELPAE